MNVETVREIIVAAESAAHFAGKETEKNSQGNNTYPCGFGIVEINVNKNSNLGKIFSTFEDYDIKKNQLGKGFLVNNPYLAYTGQNMFIRYAAARAYAKVLNDNGIPAAAKFIID